MPSRVLRRLLVVLLAVTALALLWNALGMNSTLVIDGSGPYGLSVQDDRRAASGASVARATRGDGDFGLDCLIAPGQDAPFCEMRIDLGSAARGLDLSRFDSMRLWISASGPEPRQRVRVALRDAEPADAPLPHGAARTVNQIVYEPAAYPPGTALSLARFAPATQWQDEPAAATLAAPDLRKVATIAFATDPQVEPGPHAIRVARIELDGKLVAPATLRLGLLVLWLAVVGAYLVADALVRRQRLRLSTASQHSLQRLNDSLSFEMRSLAEIAHTDTLTGAFNRKGLADELMRLVRRRSDAIFPLALVFIDIDHLKRINDEHGQETGDQVIRGLAELVRSAVQREDLFARWGGEEFLLVLRNTPGQEGRNIAERLRERIAGAKWPGGLRMTCSFGISEWRQGEDVGEGIRRADEAMYRAKQNGRDRVELELDSEPA